MDNSFDHRDFIENQDRWPNWPALPVKNTSDGTMKIGYLWAADKELIVWNGNIWSINPNDPEHNRYASATEMVADGWRVD